jgi:hypothetical protein
MGVGLLFVKRGGAAHHIFKVAIVMDGLGGAHFPDSRIMGGDVYR